MRFLLNEKKKRRFQSNFSRPYALTHSLMYLVVRHMKTLVFVSQIHYVFGLFLITGVSFLPPCHSGKVHYVI